MGKIIVLNYDGCIVPTEQPYRVNASLFHMQILINILKNIESNIILCSDRGMDFLEEAAKNFESYGIEVISIIGEGGAFIKNRKTGKVDSIAKTEQIEFCRRLKSFFMDFSDGNNYVVKENNKVAMNIFRNEEIYTRSQFYIKFQDIIAYLVSSGLIKETDLGKVQIMQNLKGFDIYPAGAGKDKALRRFLAQVGLDETIIGAGFTKNDIKWLKLIKSEFGGILLAPDNSEDEIKKYVDYVGEGDNIKGFIDALHKFFGYYEKADDNEGIQYILQS